MLIMLVIIKLLLLLKVVKAYGLGGSVFGYKVCDNSNFLKMKLF